MDFWRKVLEILDTSMNTPTLYGWFHILCWGLTLGSAALLCFLYKRGYIKNVRRVIFITGITVVILEIYKLINYGFSYEDKIQYAFPWASFPWQFCSVPMYIGVLAGITRGKVHDSLCCFLATFATFAGTAVMIYPGNVFIETIGVNIQTMVCHGSMLSIGIFLYYTNHVKTEIKTLLKGIPVFCVCLTIAVILNEVGHCTGLDENIPFDMFYVSPYSQSILPIYREIQRVIPFPWCLSLYIFGFVLAAFIVLAVAAGVKRTAQITGKGAKQTAAGSRSPHNQ